MIDGRWAFDWTGKPGTAKIGRSWIGLDGMEFTWW